MEAEPKPRAWEVKKPPWPVDVDGEIFVRESTATSVCARYGHEAEAGEPGAWRSEWRPSITPLYAREQIVGECCEVVERNRALENKTLGACGRVLVNQLCDSIIAALRALEGESDGS